MQAMCILGAMKLFRSAFPRFWLEINVFMTICQLVIMISLTSHNLINVQEKATTFVKVTLLIFFFALITSTIVNCFNRQRNREIYPMALRLKSRCFLATIIVLTIVFLVLAGYFFKDKSISTGGTPAESRNYNQDCLIGIFDQHDMWHLFSALFLCCIIFIVNSFP